MQILKFRRLFIMKKIFKRSLAAFMAVASLAVGMVGMSASAYSDSVYFIRDAGAPSNAGKTSQIWNYYADKSTSTITVSNFTRTDKYTYIFAYISVADVTSSAKIEPSGGSVSKSGIIPGSDVIASASLQNISGNIRANVSISG